MKKTDNTLIFFVILLSLAYITMLIGLGIPDSHDDFMPWLNLLYLSTFLILLGFHKTWSLNFLLFILVALVCLYLIQYANTKCDWIYGQMRYGGKLFPKLFGVPVVDLLNDFVLLYCVGILVKQLKLKRDVYNALIGAFVLMLISMVAEPVAVSLRIRRWSLHMYPFQNFGIRYIVYFLFLYFFFALRFSKRNKIYLPVFIMEVLFILLLNLEI